MHMHGRKVFNVWRKGLAFGLLSLPPLLAEWPANYGEIFLFILCYFGLGLGFSWAWVSWVTNQLVLGPKLTRLAPSLGSYLGFNLTLINYPQLSY